jgi:hypothetical protein
MEEIGKILPKILESQLCRLDPPVVEILAPLWTRVVGKALAQKCRPVTFDGGTLTLATEDEDWAEPLRQMTEEIRAHVNTFLGKPVVRHLRIARASKVRDVPAWWPKHPITSEVRRKDGTGKIPALPAHVAQALGRSRAKSPGSSRGKEY